MGIISTLKKHEAELMLIPNVVRVGIGEVRGRQVIVVFAKKGTTSTLLGSIPKRIGRYSTIVRDEISVG